MPDLVPTIAANLAAVRERIREAAGRAGRSAEEVLLVAVTKYVSLAAVRALTAAGCRELGESRPQQLVERASALTGTDIAWHLVGPLQRNKVRKVLPHVALIQSVDSRRLAEAVNRIAGELAIRVPVLLEVNLSGEAAKHGFAAARIRPILPTLAALPHISVRGLMGMAGLASGPDEARAEFAALRELRDRLRAECPEGMQLDELSMGMSGDFEIAVEEGATIVRVGSALFEGIEE